MFRYCYNEDEWQFWSFLQFTYEEAEALRQASIGEDHGHIAMGQLTVWLEEVIIIYTRYLQTTGHLAQVGGEVGEEVAEGAVVAAIAELDQEGCQHCQQAFSVLNHSLCEAEHGVCKCASYTALASGLTSCSVSML